MNSEDCEKILKRLDEAENFLLSQIGKDSFRNQLEIRFNRIFNQLDMIDFKLLNSFSPFLPQIGQKVFSYRTCRSGCGINSTKKERVYGSKI